MAFKGMCFIHGSFKAKMKDCAGHATAMGHPEQGIQLVAISAMAYLPAALCRRLQLPPVSLLLRYNLLREDSEGYAKLVTLYNQFGSAAVQQEVGETRRSYGGTAHGVHREGVHTGEGKEKIKSSL